MDIVKYVVVLLFNDFRMFIVKSDKNVASLQWGVFERRDELLYPVTPGTNLLAHEQTEYFVRVILFGGRIFSPQIQK